MQNIRENIATNIADLRKANKLSQAELGNKLAYSDKTISKWERGESLPDIETLIKIADIFNVKLEFLLEKHEDVEQQIEKTNNQKLYKRSLLCALFVLGLLFVATCIFIYGLLLDKAPWHAPWLAFIYFLPISFLFILIYMRKHLSRILVIVFLSLLLWTAILTIYLTILITLNINFWMLFITGVPIQAGIILIWFFRLDK